VSPRRNAIDDVVVAHVRRSGPVSGGRIRGACSIFGWFSAFVTIAAESSSFAAAVITARSTARTSATTATAAKGVARVSASTGGASMGGGRPLAALPGTALVARKM